MFTIIKMNGWSLNLTLNIKKGVYHYQDYQECVDGFEGLIVPL